MSVKLQDKLNQLLILVKIRLPIQQEFLHIRYLTKVLIMLEYTKTILQKVSFSPALFGKELRKSLQWLQKDEIYVLRSWCVLTFGDLYFEIISESFKGI